MAGEGCKRCVLFRVAFLVAIAVATILSAGEAGRFLDAMLTKATKRPTPASFCRPEHVNL